MKIKKALIPCAGYGTRMLPWTKVMPKEMLPLWDRPVIHYIVEEAYQSGISEILLITSKGKDEIIDYFDRNIELEHILEKKGKTKELKKINFFSELKIHTIRQPEALGLGHAVLLGESFMRDEPFAVMLPDNPILVKKPALGQLIDEYNGSSIVGVNEVKESEIPRYGIVAGEKIKEDLIEIKKIVEKPSIKDAPSNIAMLGRYIFTPQIFSHLSNLRRGVGGELQLTDAIYTLMNEEKVYAKIYQGTTYDTGNPNDYLKASIDYAKYNGAIL